MGIDFQNVVFKYDRKALKAILNQVNLSIASTNEFVMILGHTGSGKTTVVQHMNALLLPTAGEINIYDKRIVPGIKNLKLKDIRKKIGLVFQFPEYQLFEETVLKDVMFGPKNFGTNKEDAEIAARKACTMVGLPDELLDRSPFSLSGGQMRRVAIAGILASNPDILILDEPTVGLDPHGKKELMELLVRIQNETAKTIIMISHDMDIVARYAKRVVVMLEGQVKYDGIARTLFEDIDYLQSLNLDLPKSAYFALKLREKGLLKYQQLPITKEELLAAIEAQLQTGEHYE